MYKDVITKNFSKNAASYDDHAGAQARCAEKLIKLSENKQFSYILEVGCGTGLYTHALRKKHEDAEITAVDLSEDMIDIARGKLADKNIQFMVADGGQIGLTRRYDLVTSNASLQWFENLESVFGFFSRVLTDNGMFSFSMYGPETFRELKEVLEIYFGREQHLSSSRFISRSGIESILGEHFKHFDLVEECFTSEFSSLLDFLKDIKHSGTRGEGLGDIFLGKNTIKEIEKIYIEKFSKITATHHVYFAKAGA